MGVRTWRKATMAEAFAHAAGRSISSDERLLSVVGHWAGDVVAFTDGTAVRASSEYDPPYSEETGGGGAYTEWYIYS